MERCRDRERFDELCEKLNIKRPKGLTVLTEKEALEATAKLGYPVLLRPSYVLGGQNMIIAFKVKAVDTTAAGDTFTGYFIAGILAGMSVPDILKMCAKASAITVSRMGATDSIPTMDEVNNTDL